MVHGWEISMGSFADPQLFRVNNQLSPQQYQTEVWGQQQATGNHQSHKDEYHPPLTAPLIMKPLRTRIKSPSLTTPII